MKIAVCVKDVPDPGPSRRIDPGTLRMDRSGDRLAQRVRPQRRRAGAASQGEPPARARSCSSRWAPARRSTRSARDSPWAPTAPCSSRTTRPPAPTWWPPATCWPRRSAPSRPTWCCSASRRPTATARCCGRRSPTACRFPVISQISELEVDGHHGHGQASDRVRLRQDPGRRCRRCSPCPTRSTSRGTRRSRGSWAPRRSSRTSCALADVGVDADRAGQAGSRTTVKALAEPAGSRGDTLKIEDDGSGAQKILDFLLERKLV